MDAKVMTRSKSWSIGALVVGLAAVTAWPALAQVAAAPPTAVSQGWTFAVAPYAWLPTISTTYSYDTPRRGTVTNTVSANIGQYLSKINFAVMTGGEARYDRFTIMSDIVYLNASLTTDTSHFSKLNFGPGPIYIPRSQQLDTGTRLGTTIWSTAGGYTLVDGAWGYLDAVAGPRVLFFDSRTNYTLTANFYLPNRTIGLSRTGSLSLNQSKAEGFGGITGRINIPNSRFFIPYYFDVGGGDIPLTWQVYSGISWKATPSIDISAGYRYLAFSGSKSNSVQDLDIGGAIIVGNFHF